LNTQRRRSNIPPFFFIQLSPLASGRVGPLSTWFISSSYNASSYRLLSLSLSLFSMGRKEGHRRPGSSLKRSSEYYKLMSHTKMRLLPWRSSSSCSFFFFSPHCIYYLKCCISAMYWKNILSRLTVGSCIHSFLFSFFFVFIVRFGNRLRIRQVQYSRRSPDGHQQFAREPDNAREYIFHAFRHLKRRSKQQTNQQKHTHTHSRSYLKRTRRYKSFSWTFRVVEVTMGEKGFTIFFLSCRSFRRNT
jgi:hypothetical protein